MDSMVDRVARLLDKQGIGRFGRSHGDLSHQITQSWRPSHRHKEAIGTPPKSTGEFDTFEKQKERERKDLKRRYPNAKLKWSDARKKWLIYGKGKKI